MKASPRHKFVFHVLIIFIYSMTLVAATSSVTEEQAAETVFREAVALWQSQNGDWSPWKGFGDKVSQHFEASPPTKKLEWIGALEEGILAIERTVFQQHGGADAVRDATLSILYTKYAQILSSLSPELCKNLALDPHTLLIGADTITESTEPSKHLCIENAENSLRNAVTLDATNTEATQLLEELLGTSGDVVHRRKPKEFVAELFDSFADTFDDKLVKGLQYRVPQLVGDLAAKLLLSLDDDEQRPSRYYTAVLDAGCGTGLAGRYLQRLLAPDGGILIGVDASQKMLEKARECTITSGCGLETKNDEGDTSPLYDALLQLDLDDMTLSNTLHHDGIRSNNAFDLIVAADVLVYFGSLEHILNTFAKLSDSRGTTADAFLIFSCEVATPEEAPLGWRLLPSGRFAHTKQHATEMATNAGYQLVQYEEIVPRMEKGEPVRGHLFGFRLSGGQSGDEHSSRNSHREPLDGSQEL